MKRIEFIAPVEAVRGNLSGRQDLRYAENNNKAYESPAGSVNYARNYTPRYVGAKIAATGAKIFSVRTKNAVNMSPKAIKAMALLGGTGAIVGAILANKTGAPYANAYAQWLELKNLGSTDSFRKTLSGWVRKALVTKSQFINFTGPRPLTTINNPWYDGSQTAGATISQSVLVEFWGQLAPDAVVFTVNGLKGIGKTTTAFGDIVATPSLNVLGLAQTEADFITWQEEYLKDDNGNYVLAEVYPVNGGEYTITDVEPEP
jgi:hypothetical protein